MPERVYPKLTSRMAARAGGKAHGRAQVASSSAHRWFVAPTRHITPRACRRAFSPVLSRQLARYNRQCRRGRIAAVGCFRYPVDIRVVEAQRDRGE